MSITAAMIAAATQVAAVPAPPSTVPSVTAPAQSEGGTLRAKGPRYCVIGATTGSRIPRKTCRTRDGWLVDGFDPLGVSGR